MDARCGERSAPNTELAFPWPQHGTGLGPYDGVCTLLRDGAAVGEGDGTRADEGANLIGVEMVKLGGGGARRDGSTVLSLFEDDGAGEGWRRDDRVRVESAV